MVEKVFDIIKDNLKNPKLYIALLTIIVVILLLFPYIDANFFYYNRVEKRIDILKAISDIETEKVENNSILKAEYENILEEIRPDIDFSVNNALIDEKIMDSIDVVSLVGELSDEFDIMIRPKDLTADNFNSVDKIVKMIEKKKNEEEK